MTMQAAPAEPLDRAFLAEIESYLAAYGLKVTKARAVRGTSTSTTESGRPDGCVPTKAPKGHRCAAHWRVPGMRKPVCIVAEGVTIKEDGRDTGELVPAEWTDTDTVLAFAVDVASRKVQGRAVLDAANAERYRHGREHTGPDAVRDPSCSVCRMDAWHEAREARIRQYRRVIDRARARIRRRAQADGHLQAQATALVERLAA